MKLKHGPNNVRSIRKADRMDRTEELLLEGCRISQIAVALGLSYATVLSYVNEIAERRRAENPEEYEETRRLLVAQHQEVIRRAYVEFHRSMQGTETVTTRYEMESCPACKGGGFDGTKWCKACGGDGELMTEVVTRSVKGQCGDQAYLTVVREGLKEIARLLCVPVKPLKLPKMKIDEVKQLNLSMPEDLYRGAPRDLLVATMIAHEKLKRAAVSGRKVIDAEVIEEEETDAT